MARLARVEYEGAIYHVTVRGNQRRKIFNDDRDRGRFIQKLEEYAEVFQVRLYAFCLMSNHVHLVLETALPNLGRFMHRLQTAYTVFYNTRHRLAGHLMQGRYKAKPVEGDDYLLKLMRYVHLNPVFTKAWRSKSVAERVIELRAYRWSSYAAYTGKPSWKFVNVHPLLEMMEGRTEARRRAAMRRFIERAIQETDEEFMRAARESPLCLGSEAFRDRIQDLYEAATRKALTPEDVALRSLGRALSAKRVVEVVCGVMGVGEEAVRRRARGAWLRPILADALARHAGLTQREIAAVMGLRTGKAVSMQLACLRAAAVEEGELTNRIKQIEVVLSKE